MLELARRPATFREQRLARILAKLKGPFIFDEVQNVKPLSHLCSSIYSQSTATCHAAPPPTSRENSFLR